MHTVTVARRRRLVRPRLLLHAHMVRSPPPALLPRRRRRHAHAARPFSPAQGRLHWACALARPCSLLRTDAEQWRHCSFALPDLHVRWLANSILPSYLTLKRRCQHALQHSLPSFQTLTHWPFLLSYCRQSQAAGSDIPPTPISGWLGGTIAQHAALLTRAARVYSLLLASQRASRHYLLSISYHVLCQVLVKCVIWHVS